MVNEAMTDKEMIETLLVALKAAHAMGLDVRYAEGVAEGGEWLLLLFELEGILDTKFVVICGGALKAVRTHMGNPANPYA